MAGRDKQRLMKPHLWLIKLIGMIIPRRLRTDWRQEWEAELRYREALLAEWDRLDWRHKLDLLWRSTSAFWDALWLQPQRLEQEIIQDLRYGARMLLKNPGFTVVVVIVLALGIGANTAIFSVVNAVLLKPFPYPDPQRLVWVTSVYQGEEFTGANFYLHWQMESSALEHLVAFKEGGILLTGRGEPERLKGVSAAADLFPALGVAPQLGRAFTAEEDRPGGEPVVVLSYAFWQRRFGGDPAIIGQPLTLGGESRLAIGVMPPDFRFIRDAEVLMPLGIDAEKELTGGRTGILENIFGRLKPGFTVEQAQTELDSILRSLEQSTPIPPGLQAKVTPLAEKLFGRLRQGLLALFGAVALVLLIACANVANLMLGRAQVRQREMAIRAALGASRKRLVRQMLTESLLLSVCGGLAGLCLGLLSVKVLVALAPDDLAQIRHSSIDRFALGFTFLATLLTGVATGIVAALKASRIDLHESLKVSARSSLFSKRKSAGRVSPALVVGELAMTLVLLVGAALLVKSFLRVRAVDPGFSTENLLTMIISLNPARYAPAQQRLLYQELLTRVDTLPGVRVATIGTPLPLTGPSQKSNLFVVGRPLESESQLPLVEPHEVSPNYFHAMGMQIRAGRSFVEQDDENAPPVVVINETLARRHFPEEDPIGKRIRCESEDPELTIIGVAADVKRFGLEAESQAEIYSSYRQLKGALGLIKLAVRTTGDPLQLASAVRQQVRAFDPDLPVESVMTMEQRLSRSVAPRRFQMMLFGLFAAVALVVAAVGVYGVISYSVSGRMHEIGVRMALGAGPRNVLLIVIRQGVSLALIGVSIGLAAALALTRLMSSLLFDVKATDPATFAGISLSLVGVVLLAAWLPARRAARLEPMVALRQE